MATPFNVEHAATPWDGPTGVVTLVEDGAFCLCAASGDITPGGALGLFHGDIRLLSQWELRIDGSAPDPLSVQPTDPFAGVFVARAGNLLVVRRRIVDAGLVEELTLRNVGPVHAAVTITVELAADFASVLAVKNGLVPPPASHRSARTVAGLTLSSGGHGVVVSTDRPDALIARSSVTFHAGIGPRDTWRATLSAAPGTGVSAVRHPVDLVTDSRPARRAAAWRADAAQFSADAPPLAATLRRSLTDLGVLRIGDPALPTIAAGSPWYLTLFGRDSLLTAWSALPANPRLALGTLHALARVQGRTNDPVSEEEPGRIPHEVRAGWGPGSPLAGRNAYYGTADATPLFVMLLGELYRWGFAEHARPLLPHADRALSWITGHRDGFVSYRRATDHGLLNQGWKDSADALSFHDGRLAEAPIALCEVQAYVYGAYEARAAVAVADGDSATAEEYRARASALRRSFNERFWIADRGYVAFALDRDGRQVDAATSNMGHCLWTGILDAGKAGLVADQLISPELFSGWGVRTLSTAAGRYNPVSYHNGSVWPHDTAIVVAGLMRYGFTDHAQRIATGLLDAAEHFDGRLPELFCGFDREEFATPVAYPSSCSPQAWAAAAPLLLVRSLLRLDPDGALRIAPALPPEWGELRLDGLRVGGNRLTIVAKGIDAKVTET